MKMCLLIQTTSASHGSKKLLKNMHQIYSIKKLKKLKGIWKEINKFLNKFSFDISSYFKKNLISFSLSIIYIFNANPGLSTWNKKILTEYLLDQRSNFTKKIINGSYRCSDAEFHWATSARWAFKLFKARVWARH